MNDGSLRKYQCQAARLGLKNINTTHIDVLLSNIVQELKSGSSAGSLTLEGTRYARIPKGIRCETTLYEYYNSMIRDTVKQIREPRGISYIFSIEQIADVIKYEKDAKFKYLSESDCFMVTM